MSDAPRPDDESSPSGEPLDPTVGAPPPANGHAEAPVDPARGSPLDADDQSPASGGYASCEEALEEAVTSLERVTAERDEYLEIARRVQADFENFRKRVESQRVELTERAAERLVLELLPVLDACEAAVSHGADDVAPIQSSLEATLSKQGLARVADIEVGFDPTVHEAVLSEGASPGQEGPVVAQIMRTGYLWNGRVVRPAMVKVRG